MNAANDACIEYLRPKTVPEGLVALGTISQVSEIQLKVQITGGITCIVNANSINDVYCQQLENYRQNPNDSSLKPVSLTQMFKRGQQYVCKIMEKAPRKGYSEAIDILATFDPSSINEDTLPRALLAIPQVPMQCVVKSVEDHVYLMDVGFKGLTGSLSFKDSAKFCKKNNDGNKFAVGQVVRCCLKNAVTLEDGVRVVQLTLDQALMKQSEFSQDKVVKHELTERSILPGSRSFLTVMKTRKDGLMVNLMNEFSGFVHINHLEKNWQNPLESYKVSDQLKCTVLYYNNTTKTFALSLKSETEILETINLFNKRFHTGQIIEDAKVAYLSGSKSIYFKIEEHFRAIANVKDAIEQDVAAMSKDDLLTELDQMYPDQSSHRCRIKSINYADLLLVVGLRQDFLKLPCLSIEELKAGDYLNVKVKKYVKDGIVVEFGLNLRAIILNMNLQDYVTNRINLGKKYPVGKTIKTRVLKLDIDKQPARLYLTNKSEFMDKDTYIVTSYDKSSKGKSVFGTIIKIGNKGIIVELFNNIKGFIPNRFSSSVGTQNAAELFKIGQVISCVIYQVDPRRPSLKLSVIPYDKIMTMKQEKKLAAKEKKQSKDIKRSDAKMARSVGKMSAKSTAKTINMATAIKRPDPQDQESSDDDEDDTRPEDMFVESSSSSSSCDDEASNPHVELAESEDDEDDQEGDNQEEDDDDQIETSLDNGDANAAKENIRAQTKSRLQRSKEAMAKEQKLRDTEREQLDPLREPQSIPDFERLVLKTPNSAEVWTKYSKFFLDNVETEKARIVCRRALKTINFRMEKEKLRVWLFLIKIEAKFGGIERLRETLKEATKTNDLMSLYMGCVNVLIKCNELDEAERLYEQMIKLSRQDVEVWVQYMEFLMQHRKNLDEARRAYEKACKIIGNANDLISLKSRFARLEFKFGDVERAKTVFENILNDNPKRTDLWRVYESLIKKFGTRQVDSDEIRVQNEETLKRVADSIATVSRKRPRKA